MKKQTIDQTFDAEYMAMHRALTLLGFDVAKLVQFIQSGPEPVWADLVLGHLDMRLDLEQIRKRDLLRPEGIEALQSIFTQLRTRSHALVHVH